MESLHILTFLCLALLGSSHADSVPELYWKTVLPNTKIPTAIKSLLKSDKSNVLEASSSSPSSKIHYIHASDENQEENVKDPNAQPFHLDREDNKPQLSYKYLAKKKASKKTSNITMFFFQKDLALGKKMNLDYFKKSPPSSSLFFPRQISNTIPFHSSKLPEIFTQFSVNPKSREAEAINNTIQGCEAPEMRGEKKFCSTSLEDMIDSTLSMFGNIKNNKVEAISTEIEDVAQFQSYYTINGVKNMGRDSLVVCHKQAYPYAVFYCHKTNATKLFMVSLVGDHGGKVKAPAICHLDTSPWDPKHMAFVLLKVAPGTVPICHFLPKDHVVWTKK